MISSYIFFITMLVILISMLGYIISGTYLKKRMSFANKEKLFNAFDRQFDRGLVKDKEDIAIIMNSFNRQTEIIYSMASVLEDYSRYLTEKDSTKDKPESDFQRKYYPLIKEIILKEKEEKPFTNIPDEERRLLKFIEDSVENNELDSIKANLKELSTVIAARNKIYERTHKINNWAIGFAIVGIVLTIAFGIMSFAPRIDYKKIKQINKELLQKSYNQKKILIDNRKNKVQI